MWTFCKPEDVEFFLTTTIRVAIEEDDVEALKAIRLAHPDYWAKHCTLMTLVKPYAWTLCGPKDIELREMILKATIRDALSQKDLEALRAIAESYLNFLSKELCDLLCAGYEIHPSVWACLTKPVNEKLNGE